jgi:1-acyl-sn-glycerol-3-phosphate acyltransferase
LLARITSALIIGFARLVTGVQARWAGCGPEPPQRIYFANHASHGDFVLIWTVLPSLLRSRTRPVAARDYWGGSGVRGFLIHQVFRGVLVERGGDPKVNDPLVPLIDALDHEDSLIIFPEGTRNTEEEMLPFKSGIYHLARQRPHVDLVPVSIENIGRVMGKGQVIPVPLLCSVTFGAPIRLSAGEDKQAFLDRARQTIVELRQP